MVACVSAASRFVAALLLVRGLRGTLLLGNEVPRIIP